MSTSVTTAAAPLTTTAAESTTASWSTTDETFFRAVRELFSPTYLAGASVLLASYDEEPDCA
jgi:hypothetical protein